MATADRHRLIAVLARGRHRHLVGLGLLLLASSALPLADRGRTLLVVSNRPATIARADQVIRLDHGRAQPGPVTAGCAEAA